MVKTLTIEDQERAYYIRNGISEYGSEATPVLKTNDDMRKEYYLYNITLPVTPIPREIEMATEDLETIWLQEQSGITDTYSSEDLWVRWLQPIYGARKTINDLKYLYYKNH
jgi:hypothetical protein